MNKRKEVVELEIVVAIIGSGALSALISGIFALINGRKRKKDGVAAGVQQLLYYKIKDLSREHLENGFIYMGDLEDIEKMHKIYHDDLDGNGFLDSLMADVHQLPVIPVTTETIAKHFNPTGGNNRQENKH